jgi:hypothetical protein
VFTELHQRFWDAARAAKGDAEGTRRLCEVLLLRPADARRQLTAGIAAALQVGSTDPAVVAVEARRHAGGQVLALPVPLDSRRAGRCRRSTGPPRRWPATTPCSRCPHDRASAPSTDAAAQTSIEIAAKALSLPTVRTQAAAWPTPPPATVPPTGPTWPSCSPPRSTPARPADANAA